MSSYPPPDPGSSWNSPQGPYTGGGQMVPAEDRNWAVAAHLGSFLAAWVALGLIAPLIVLLVRGSQSPWVRRQAVESLNFQINAAVIITACYLLFFVLIGVPLLIGYLIFYAVVVIVASVRASRGEEFRYPLTVRLVT